MLKTSADLVEGWQADRVTLEKKLARLKIEGNPVPTSQMEMLATIKSLIADFSRHESFPIAFE